MASNDTKTVVVNVRLLSSEAIKNIQDLSKSVELYKTRLDAMKKAGQQNTEAYIRMEARMKEMQETIRANQKTIRDNIKAQKQNGDSINAYRAELKSLRAEYENLTKVERDSAKGTDLLNHIQELTAELKTLEAEQLDFQRNVGNYADALTGLPFGKVIAGFNSLSNGTGKLSVALKNGIQGIKAFGAQLWQLMKIPVVAVISAIAAVLMKLFNELKKNDEAMTALQRVFAAFKPVLDVINKAFAVLVDIVAKAANAVAGFISGIMSVIPGLKDYAAAEQDVVNATDALEDAEREYTVNSAKRSKEVSELRSKSVEKDKYSYEQRKKFLQQAIDLEQQDLQESRDIAKEKLRIAQQEAALEVGATKLTEEVYAKLSDEVKNHLAELEAAVYQTEEAFNSGTRRMKSQMSEFTEAEKREQKQRAQQAAQERKERLKNEREAYKELQTILVNGIRDLQSKEIAATKSSYEQQIAALKERLATEKNLTKQAKQYINSQIILLEADLQLKLGDIREKYQREQWEKNLEQQKNYYQRLLGNLTTEEARVQVRLEINDLDTKLLKGQLKTAVDDAKKTVEQAMLDLEGDIEQGISSLDYNQLAEKYGAAWEAYGITVGDNITKMRALISVYHQQQVQAEADYQNNLNAIDKAAANERLRIQKESEDKRWSLAQKHQELMEAIQGARDLDQYRFNEVEKTKILQEQAEQRLAIAQNEHQRLSEERERYTDEQLAALYGSVEEFNIKFAESELKVVEAEVSVKDAIQAVSVANANAKARMIDTAAAVASAMNSVVGSIGDLFNTLAESDEKYSDFATAMAMMQILVSTAISIANAVQGATAAAAATGPGAPIATPIFIAEMVAIVVGALASATTTLLKAKQQKQSAPKFATGGLVGNKETRRKDDTVDAKLSVGEYIIPSDVVSDLGSGFFDRLIGKKSVRMPKFPVPHFATGGLVLPNTQAIVSNVSADIDWDMMREVMRDAVSEVQPVVSVKEITRTQNRVRTKEQIANN